jgi:adenosine deaminase
MDIVRLADEYRSKGVVGIDLAGDEKNYPLDPHIPAFQYAIELGIHRTLHGGETGSSEPVRQAIEQCQAERIGHGYAIIDDPIVYDLVKKNDIHLECCLTSSIHTNAIGKYEKNADQRNQDERTRLHSYVIPKQLTWHPIYQFARDNLNFSFSCDDPSVSRITVEHEYRHALSDLKLLPAQLTRCLFNAARSAFLDENEKHLLIQRLLAQYIPSSVMKDYIIDSAISCTSSTCKT